MKKSCMIALLVLTAATGVQAAEKDQKDPKEQAASATDTTQPEAAAPVKEKMICRSEQVTGSRTHVNRTCMTKAQWDELAEKTRKNLSDYDQNSSRAAASKGPFGG